MLSLTLAMAVLGNVPPWIGNCVSDWLDGLETLQWWASSSQQKKQSES